MFGSALFGFWGLFSFVIFHLPLHFWPVLFLLLVLLGLFFGLFFFNIGWLVGFVLLLVVRRGEGVGFFLFFFPFFLPHETFIFREPVPWKGHIDILKGPG